MLIKRCFLLEIIVTDSSTKWLHFGVELIVVNLHFSSILNRPVGLLKQLLVQRLALPDTGTPEDWPHFSRRRPASPGPQADGGTQNFENVKADHPGEEQMPLRTGAAVVSTCLSSRTSTDSYASGDSVTLAFQESQAGALFVTGPQGGAPEAPTVEPDAGLDESGERFFDAREAHSDDNPSEGDATVRKEEKDVNSHISGKRSHL